MGDDPAVQVIITDTQAAFDAAQRLFPTLGTILTNGDAEPGDFSALTGRRVVIMPTAGRDLAARAVAAALAAFAVEIKLVLPESTRAAGWSLADEPEWDTADAKAWAQRNFAPLTEPYNETHSHLPAPQGADSVTTGTADHPPPPLGATGQTPADAGTAHDALGASEPPDLGIPPIGSPTPPRGRKKRRGRADLSLVEGNLAHDPEPGADPLPASLSEDAFADDFATQYGEDWRYVKAWGQWLHWDAEAWLEVLDDKQLEPMRYLYRAALGRPEALQLTPDGRRKLGRGAAIYSSLRMAGADARIRSTPDQWNTDPFMLGVPGGVIDLREGKLIEAAREQHITMRCPVAPAAGKPETWLRLLHYWLGDDDEVIGFARRFFGYSMTGDGREQCMVFFYGPAQSGKGTILRLLSYILGSVPPPASNKFQSYHYEAPIATFLETRNDRHSTELAAMHLKRLITSEEPAAGAKWDEAKIKWMTGGQFITARFMHGDNFSFSMTGKIIVAANHRPRLATTDASIRRRMHVIPFDHPVPDEDRDNALDARLRDEAPQILAWLIDACLEWQQCGLGLPEKIASSTDTYLQAEDILAQWIDEACDRDRDSDSAGLYRCYCKWADEQGEKIWSRRAWANALVERGFKTRRGSQGMRMFCDLAPRLGEPT